MLTIQNFICNTWTFNITEFGLCKLAYTPTKFLFICPNLLSVAPTDPSPHSFLLCKQMISPLKTM